MYKLILKSRAIQIVTGIMILMVMLSIYPIRAWYEEVPSVSNQQLAGSSDQLMVDYVLQRFIAQYDHLETIDFYVTRYENGWNKGDQVSMAVFRMFDSDMNMMFDEEVEMRFNQIPGYIRVYVNEDLEVGKDYYYFIQGGDCSIWVGLEESATNGTDYVSRMVYNYDELEGYNVIAKYNYSVPMRKQKVLMADALLLLLWILIFASTSIYYKKSGKDKLVTWECVLRYTLNPILALFVVGSLICVLPMSMFSTRIADKAIYTAGILLFGGSAFYLLNKKKDREQYVPLGKLLSERGTCYLQAIFFALCIYACNNYMNGLYDIHHMVAERQLMVFFALALLCMTSGRMLVNKYTCGYGLVALIAGVVYYSKNIESVSDGDLGRQALLLGIWTAALGGLCLLTLILQLVKERKSVKVSKGLGIMVVLFFAVILVFRNTRMWPVTLVVAFGMLYAKYILWDKKALFLDNVCNGLILNFLGSMVFSLMHRPFLSWVYPRFPFIFHTVTVTSVYLTVILCAVMVKLADKYRKTKSIREMWAEIVMFGVVATYLVFTASRTGFLAAGVMVILVVVLAADGLGVQKLKNAGKIILSMILAVIISFPIMFTAQRTLPAVFHDVHKYEIETFEDAVVRGNEKDSMYYITIARFVEVFNNKIFNIPEAGANAYEKSQAYQDYRARRYDDDGDVILTDEEIFEQKMQEALIKDQLAVEANDDVSIEYDPSIQDGVNSPAIEQIITPGDHILADGVKDGISEESRKKIEDEDFVESEPGSEAVWVEDVEEENQSMAEVTEEYANGRMSIFKSYLSNLNLTGHNEMGALLEDGSIAAHAHNSYIQVMYDNGIIAGVLFLLLGVMTFVYAIIYYMKKKDVRKSSALPLAVVAVFAVAGLVEWIFHLCHPAGFTLMLVLTPLLFDLNSEV